MTAPTQRAGGLDANARGILVLVAAVAIGLLLLWKAGGTGDATPIASGTTSTTVDTSGIGDEGDDTTTTTGGEGEGDVTTTTAETTGRAPGDVTVLVLNGSGIAGAAGDKTETIDAAGYQMGSPSDANAQLEATAVYYAEGYQAEATQVASVLGKAASVVAPMPDPVPGPGADTANVVVVLGAADTSPTAGTDDAATTTTTAAN